MADYNKSVLFLKFYTNFHLRQNRTGFTAGAGNSINLKHVMKHMQSHSYLNCVIPLLKSQNHFFLSQPPERK